MVKKINRTRLLLLKRRLERLEGLKDVIKKRRDFLIKEMLRELNAYEKLYQEKILLIEKETKRLFEKYKKMCTFEFETDEEINNILSNMDFSFKELKEKEEKIVNLLKEIVKVNKKYHSIKDVLIPEIKREIYLIKNWLEEKEREEFIKFLQIV